MDEPTILAIDGNSLVHRSFHAQAHSGQPTWAVRGLLTQLVAAVDRIRPVAVVIGFDDAQRSRRRELWPSYKANRGEKLETLVEQLAGAVAAMRQLGIAVVVPDGLEADDVLASVAAFSARAGARTVIVTSDRDAFALIDDNTHVLRIINGGVDASPLMTPERLIMLLGIRPAQYRDFAALRGDPSDNLPGVRGIGPHHAKRLLTEFGSAAAAFDDLDTVRTRLGAGVASRLGHPDARAAWQLNCRVMAMHDDIPLGLELDGGAGALPLPAAAVEAVFGAQNLTWSVGQAVRVLAGVEPPDASAPRTFVEPELAGWPGARTTTPLPRLARRTPRADQLALFD